MQTKKENVLTLLKNRTENYSDRVALGMKNQYGWKEFTYSGVGLLSRKLAHYQMTGLQFYQNQNLNLGHVYLHQF